MFNEIIDRMEDVCTDINTLSSLYEVVLDYALSIVPKDEKTSNLIISLYAMSKMLCALEAKQDETIKTAMQY